MIAAKHCQFSAPARSSPADEMAGESLSFQCGGGIGGGGWLQAVGGFIGTFWTGPLR